MTEEQMNMLGLEETVNGSAKTNRVRWYGYVLRSNNDSVMRVALNLEVSIKRKSGRSKNIWKKHVEEETEKINLKKKNALNRAKWKDGVQTIAKEMG